MYNFLKLIRYKNLLIVAATQYIMRFFIIKPQLEHWGFDLQTSELDFALLVLATVLLTAAGYIINDYFDHKTDVINRPDDVVIDKEIPRRSAIAYHVIFNILGVLLGAFVSWRIGHFEFVAVFVIITGILWYYSTSYKRQFFIGNFLVALMTAMVPFLVVLYEIPLLNSQYGNLMVNTGRTFYSLLWWVLGFAYFAFLTTLFREIIKDMEDFEGDYEFGRNSLPVILGIFYTKLIVCFLIMVTIASLVFFYVFYIQNSLTLWYFLFALITPMLFLFYRVVQAKSKENYRFASNLTKLIMLGGLGYAVIIYIFS